MSFDFPGANTSFENHNVSEESFWPSFTDIMMVIVMVFLLVTVSVILNNYQLVETLKKTMQAEQLAASIAEDTQVENSSLEDRLKQLEKQLALLNSNLVTAQKDAELSREELLLSQKNIEALNALTEEQKQQLEETSASLVSIEEKAKQDKEAALLKQTQIQQALAEKTSQIKALTSDKQSKETALQQALEKAKLDFAKQKELEKKKYAQQQALLTQLQKKEADSKDKYGGLQEQIATLQEALTEKNTQFADLQAKRETEETQLLSLQGKLESLDKKYQKLLRPARSSKGKFIVSVTYSKSGRRDIYRIKSNPEGDYQQVSRAQLDRKLEALKKRHTSNLYVKVIIPENSGLSYNDAWRFTNGVQKSYDYYYQEDTSKKEGDTEETDDVPAGEG